MLRNALEGMQDVVLHHSAPTAADAIFGAELRALAAQGRIRLIERHTATEGMVTVDDVAALVPDWEQRQTWACGPTGLLDAAEEHWGAKGIADQLHTERFRPTVLATGQGGTVAFARSGVTLESDGATPRLDAGENAGVLMPSGCRMGICFGCVVPLREGAVRDLRNGGITTAAPGGGAAIQPCVSAAAGTTDLLELWVVDHEPGVTVRSGSDGSLYSVTAPLGPLAAQDGQGNDLLAWLTKRDGLIWEPEPAAQRQEVVLTFPKPAGAQQAKLVASATETPWAGEMAGRMLGLLGPQLPAWYEQIDRKPAARQELLTWMAAEELFPLRIEVEEATGWQVRGMMPIAGPSVSDERVVPLDVSRAVGNQLRVRLRPPAGFWAFNPFAVDYSEERPLPVRRLEPLRARDATGRDLLPALRVADGQYYEMHQVGERATVAFAAPSAVPGMERTLFLHSRGYYHMHIAADGEPDVAAFQRILTEPGAGTAFSAKVYAGKSR